MQCMQAADHNCPKPEAADLHHAAHWVLGNHWGRPDKCCESVGACALRGVGVPCVNTDHTRPTVLRGHEPTSVNPVKRAWFDCAFVKPCGRGIRPIGRDSSA